MSEASTLSVTTGPQRGKVFEILQELVHIGTAPENEIVIEDDGLNEHQASIVRRDNRFAIFAPDGAEVEIDGSVIPPKRWVWLPASAMINLGGRTTCQFQSHEGNGDDAVPVSSTASVAELSDIIADAPDAEPESEPESEPASSPTSAEPESQPKRSRKRKRRSGKRKREVARFLTDKSGDALVQLGEDGTMPELTLEADADKKKVKDKSSKEGNPLILYIALGMSFVMSLSLMVLDLEPAKTSVEGVAAARRELAEMFYGDDSEELAPYQQLLRDARFSASRGDTVAEMQAYRKVLRLLNSEDIDRYTGLTGSETTDKRLKELLATLLNR